MSSGPGRWWWSCAVVGGVLAVVLGRSTAAGEARAAPRIGRVCLGDLRVDLAPPEGTEEGLLTPGTTPGDRCALRDPIGVLPGEGVLRAETADGRGALAVGAVGGAVLPALERARAALEEHGWNERPAAGLARSRRPSLPVTVMERGGAVLFVIGVERGAGGAFVISVGWRGSPAGEEER